MASPYTGVVIDGYNASPPDDDGSQVATNQVEWSKHTSKIGDPLKTAIESLDTNVQSAFTDIYGQTQDESDGLITPENYEYFPNEKGFQHVLRHGTNTSPGTTDMAAALQAAVDSLSETEGGVVIVPAGRYSIQSKVQVLGSTFVNGGVQLWLHPRAVLEIEGSATGGIEFLGDSAASPLNGCGIVGGRVVGTTDGADYGVKFENCTNCYVSPQTSVVGFQSTVRSTRAGVYLRYSIWSRVDAQVDNCDFGVNVEGDSTDAFRGTTCAITGSIRTCYRGIRLEDVFSADINAWVENNSIGLLCDYKKTTGVNCAAIDVRGHFERNGYHARVSSQGTARARGIKFDGCLFENLNTTYSAGGAFEDAGAGDYKLDIDGDYCIIDGNYWSSAAAVDDIKIASTAVGTEIRRQMREPVTGFTVENNSDSTIFHPGSCEEYQALTDADATPSVKDGNTFVTGNTGATTITDLDDGYVGKEVVVRFGDSQTTVDFTGTNLRGNVGVDWSPVTNDFMVARKVTSTIWLCEVHDTTA